MKPFRDFNRPKISKQAVFIARNAVKEYLLCKKTSVPPAKLYSPLKNPAGVFVTIVKNGVVVGCMGTVQPSQPNAAAEIIRSAIMAATADPWHKSILPDELGDLKYIISVVGELRAVYSPSDLNPAKLGLLVRYKNRSALLLPGEAKTIEWQIYECKRKAGISQNRPVQMYVFETVTLE